MKALDFTTIENTGRLFRVEKYETAAGVLEAKNYEIIKTVNTSTGWAGKDKTVKTVIFLNGVCVGFGSGSTTRKNLPAYEIKSRISYLEAQIKGYQE